MNFIKNIKSIFSHDPNDSGYQEWGKISESLELTEIEKVSYNKIQLIYKHSTRCATSYFALQNLQNFPEEIFEFSDLYLVDVIGQRRLSAEIADRYDIRHESPQVIILQNGEVIWHGSHSEIRSDVILKVINQT